jgi:hypothetical protein
MPMNVFFKRHILSSEYFRTRSEGQRKPEPVGPFLDKTVAWFFMPLVCYNCMYRLTS